MNIFISAGTQLPFSRLLKAVDLLSKKYPDVNFMFQGKLDKKKIKLNNNVSVVELMDRKQYEDEINKADFVLSHAGIGSILSLVKKRKPFAIFPRLKKYNEHRNNHQFDTAVSIQKNYNAKVFFSIDDIILFFESYLEGGAMRIELIFQDGLARHEMKKKINCIINQLSV